MKALILLTSLTLLLAACQAVPETEVEPTTEVVEVNTTATGTPVPSPASTMSATLPPTVTTIVQVPTQTDPPVVEVPSTSPSAPVTSPEPASRAATNLQMIPLAQGFIEPVYLTHAGDERLFVVEKRGTIQVVEDSQIKAVPFLDIQSIVSSSAYEQGLLSIAFHPDFKENGTFFVNYTDLDGATVIARYEIDPDNPNQADPASGSNLMRIPQPYPNHNGGQLQFGPDNYLYIGMGDGGSGGDPQSRAQDGSVLLGKMLRIDVDGEEPYGLPEDNPFYAMSSRRNEIWATGVRNPWRFAFDRQTGDLFIADVGQGLWEEINFQPATSAGGENYGWNIMEGSHCYFSSECDTDGLVLPIGEYTHEDGNCSVTGGYVYRGQQTPEMGGNYIFGDYCSGKIWRLFQDQDGTWSQAQIADTDMYISSFGQDASGELYVLDMIGGTVFRLVLS